MVKIGAPVVGPMDAIQIARTPGVRMSSTPFGPAGTRTFYIGRAVPWKMVKGIENVRAINSEVAAGLEKAISISMAAAGTYGVSLARYTAAGRKPGALILIPTKAAKQMVAQGTGEIVASYGSSWEALQAMRVAPAVAPAITT